MSVSYSKVTIEVVAEAWAVYHCTPATADYHISSLNLLREEVVADVGIAWVARGGHRGNPLRLPLWQCLQQGG